MVSLLWALPGKFFALFIGIYYFGRLSMPYKLILFQVVLALAAESYGKHLAFQHQYNSWVFNIYNLTDLLLTGCTAAILMKEFKYHYIAFFLVGILSLEWVGEVYKYGIHHLANWFFILSCILLVGLYVGVLFNRSLFTKGIVKEPAFWLSISVILYFGCSVPYFGLYNYLVTEKLAMAENLWIINRVLNFARYPLIGVGFLMAGKEKLNYKMAQNV